MNFIGGGERPTLNVDVQRRTGELRVTTFAAIAQLRMRCARADARTMSPAARAFLIRRLRDCRALVVSPCSSSRSLRMKNSSSSSFGMIRDRSGIAAQHDARFERVADQFLLPRLFDCLRDHAAQVAAIPAQRAPRVGRAAPRRLWKFLEVDRATAPEITPRFFRGEGEDRREQLDHRLEDLVHRGLRRAAARRIGRVAIHPVLRDVDVEAAQIDRAELIQRVIDLVELVGGIRLAAFGDDLLQADAGSSDRRA